MTATQSEFEARLPIGYTDEGGQLQRHAVLRKMRGYDEDLLYNEELNAGRLVTELLASCVLRLGNIDSPGVEILSRLYTADRNFLLLELRRITLGNSLLATYLCPQCGQQVTRMEDLRELEVKRLADNEAPPEIHLTLEDGYQDRKGETHRELTLGMPLGEDEEFVAPMVRRDPHKAQDALLLRCIHTFGSLTKNKLEAFGVKILRELPLGDRQRIRNAMNGQLPGVNFQRHVHCEPCGNDFTGTMDVSGFFALG